MIQQVTGSCSTPLHSTPLTPTGQDEKYAVPSLQDDMSRAGAGAGALIPFDPALHCTALLSLNSNTVASLSPGLPCLGVSITTSRKACEKPRITTTPKMATSCVCGQQGVTCACVSQRGTNGTIYTFSDIYCMPKGSCIPTKVTSVTNAVQYSTVQYDLWLAWRIIVVIDVSHWNHTGIIQ